MVEFTILFVGVLLMGYLVLNAQQGLSAGFARHDVLR